MGSVNCNWRCPNCGYEKADCEYDYHTGEKFIRCPVCGKYTDICLDHNRHYDNDKYIIPDYNYCGYGRLLIKSYDDKLVYDKLTAAQKYAYALYFRYCHFVEETLSKYDFSDELKEWYNNVAITCISTPFNWISFDHDFEKLTDYEKEIFCYEIFFIETKLFYDRLNDFQSIYDYVKLDKYAFTHIWDFEILPVFDACDIGEASIFHLYDYGKKAADIRDETKRIFISTRYINDNMQSYLDRMQPNIVKNVSRDNFWIKNKFFEMKMLMNYASGVTNDRIAPEYVIM